MNKKESTIVIAEQILKNSKTSLDVYTLFDKVAEVKEFTPEEVKEKIGQFHTYLTVDGRFIILSDGTWALRVEHPYDLVNTISTDFDLFEDEEFVAEDEEDYEGMEVIVVTDEEELEKEKKDIKNLIGYEENDEL